MDPNFPYLTRNVRPSQQALVAGAGLEMIDSTGRVLFDLGSQTSNLSIGQSHPAVANAVAKQVQQLLYSSSSFANEPFRELSRRLVALAPAGLTVANLMMCNGSDAVETACKMARVYKWSPKLLAIRGAWHGESMGTLALSSGYRGSLLTTDSDIVHSDEPTLASLVDLVEANPDAAGVVIDPAGVSNGLFSRADIAIHLPRLRELCTQHDIILIFDEVQSFGGFLGSSLFAAHEFGVTPDVLCIAKAIAGGMPLAGVLCRADLGELLSHNEAEFTNGANPVSCAAALAFLDVYEETRDLVRRNAAAFQDAITQLAGNCPFLEHRNHGFIATFRLLKDGFREMWAGRAVSIALQDGIVLRTTNFGENVMLKPSIVIEPAKSREAIPRLTAVFRSAFEATESIGASPGDLRARVSAGTQYHEEETVAYFTAVLASVDPSITVRIRTGPEIVELTGRLPRMGIWTHRGFPTESGSIAYEPSSGTALDLVLATTEPLSNAVVNGLLSQYLRSIESAHANNVILGGRWGPNAVVNSSMSVRLIDFGIAYTGDFRLLAAFEELFSLLDFGARVPDPTHRRKLVRRAGPAVFRRWGDDAARAWRGVRRAHVGELSGNGWGGPAAAYPDVIEAFDDVAAEFRRSAVGHGKPTRRAG